LRDDADVRDLTPLIEANALWHPGTLQMAQKQKHRQEKWRPEGGIDKGADFRGKRSGQNLNLQHKRTRAPLQKIFALLTPFDLITCRRLPTWVGGYNGEKNEYYSNNFVNRPLATSGIGLT
jgi:hypothetical protein